MQREIIANKYIILKHVSSGGFGSVFKGWDSDLKRMVAIKKIIESRSMDDKFHRMFIDEAVNSAKLNHENIISVYDFIKEKDGVYYIVMEFARGKNLHEILKKSREAQSVIPPEICGYIISRICLALDYAHNRSDDRTGAPLNIVHRDITPSNVMLFYEGRVKLADFGIAKADVRESELTVTGELKGKIPYMSPEQAKGQKVDSRSDLFSLGIVLYEILCGERPFKGDTDLEVLQSIAKVKPDLSKLESKNLSPRLKEIIKKSLDRSPESRYRTALSVYEDMAEYLSSAGFSRWENEIEKFMHKLFSEEIEKEKTESKIELAIIDETRIEMEGRDLSQTVLVPALAQDRQETGARGKKGKRNLKKVFVPVAAAIIAITMLFLTIEPLRAVMYDFINPAALSVKSLPEDALVEINGAARGSTPLRLKSIEPGIHDVRLTKYGYAPVAGRVKIEGIDSTNIEKISVINGDGVEQVKRNELNFVFGVKVFVSSNPSGSEIFLDGAGTGVKTPAEIRLKMGQHEIEVKKQGFMDPGTMKINLTNESMEYDKEKWSYRKYVSKENLFVYDISAKLYKIISIDNFARAGDARVFLDGTPIKTDSGKLMVGSGIHEIRIEKDGYKAYSRKINVDWSTNSIAYELKKEMYFTAKDVSGRTLDAEVIVDGTRIGFSPVEKYGIREGAHRAIFRKNGYHGTPVDFNTSAGKSVSAVLPSMEEKRKEEKKAVPVAVITPSKPKEQETVKQPEKTEEIKMSEMTDGKIVVKPAPPDAVVYLDGEYQGQGLKIFKNLKRFSKHQIMLQHPDFKVPLKLNVDLSVKKSVNIEVIDGEMSIVK